MQVTDNNNGWIPELHQTPSSFSSLKVCQDGIEILYILPSGDLE